MNVLLMSLMYPDDQLEEVTRNAKDKLQNQINSYQRAFVQGIRQNLQEGERLDIVNSLPVGIWPLQYRQLFLKGGMHDEGSIRQLGCINLPWLKQHMRMQCAARALEAWARQSPQNRTVLMYTQYLPYLQAAAKVKRTFPELKAAVIVTDLPNELGLPSGRTGWLKQIEYRRGMQSMALCRRMDGFVLLTEPMAQALQVETYPRVVIEGLILEDSALPQCNEKTEEPPVVLYTGTLERGLGIGEMLEAFQKLPQYQLWICGQGGMRAEVEEAASRCSNIRYFGFVPQKEALTLQARATALINPRQPSGTFTRYSFPSKTLEYMRSGKPVLCCRLEGIPADYEPYLCWMEAGVQGMVDAVQRLMQLSAQQRQQIGQLGRDYVRQNKNPALQCRKLMRLLRGL